MKRDTISPLLTDQGNPLKITVIINSEFNFHNIIYKYLNILKYFILKQGPEQIYTSKINDCAYIS